MPSQTLQRDYKRSELKHRTGCDCLLLVGSPCYTNIIIRFVTLEAIIEAETYYITRVAGESDGNAKEISDSVELTYQTVVLGI